MFIPPPVYSPILPHPHTHSARPPFGLAVPHGWQLACGRALWSGRDPGCWVSVPASPSWDFTHFTVSANGWDYEWKHLKQCLDLQCQISGLQMQPKVVWRPSERIPAALLVTWGKKEVLKGVQLHSQPAVDGWDEEEEDEKRTSKQRSCGLILIWLSVPLFSWPTWLVWFQDPEQVKYLLSTFSSSQLFWTYRQEQGTQ